MPSMAMTLCWPGNLSLRVSNLSSDQHNQDLSRTIASTATLKLAQIPASNLLYTPIEERFERLTRLARQVLRLRVAAVTLVSPDKQWFKSVSGWSVLELPREDGLCAWTLREGRMTVIEDTAKDPRTAEHSLVQGGPHFRFYAGAPLYETDDSIIGTFCVLDDRPHQLTDVALQSFKDLAALVQNEIYADRLSSAHTALTNKLGVARREAMMDPLTRLWNRRGAMVMLKEAFAAADQNDFPTAIALLDLDNFKRVNDTYGHQIGDELLRRLGSRLVSSVRGDDVTCRIGGDEFLLLMTDTNERMAAQVSERVRRAITESPIPTRQGNIPMSLSVGFTVRQPKEQITLDELLDKADRGLMKSKSDGRNLVRGNH